MHNYLQKILEYKRQEVAELAKNAAVSAQLQPIMDGHLHDARHNHFERALVQPGLSVIAEVKRRSPSKGDLAAIKDPVALATEYEQAGSVAISVLTDKHGFDGCIEDLSIIADAVSCPVLRKDFIIDELQIAEAIAHGATAVLLIVAVLGDKTKLFVEHCYRMGADALVEVHNETEVQIAIDSGARIIGVNNRNLTTFEVDPDTALRLRDVIPAGAITVAESGIRTLERAKQYQAADFDAVLIGEALVTADSPRQFIEAINHDQT